MYITNEFDFVPKKIFYHNIYEFNLMTASNIKTNKLVFDRAKCKIYRWETAYF